MYSGAIALTAAATLAASASAQSATTAAAFGFDYVGSYGSGGLSQPYSGPTTTGRSYGTGVAVDAAEPSQ
jgi:hypothetical protein